MGQSNEVFTLVKNILVSLIDKCKYRLIVTRSAKMMSASLLAMSKLAQRALSSLAKSMNSFTNVIYSNGLVTCIRLQVQTRFILKQNHCDFKKSKYGI